MDREPVITANTIVAFITAVIVLAVAFGLPMTEQQQAAIVGVVIIVAPILAAFWARTNTTPLSRPRDADGEVLTRIDGTQPLKARK